jgi:nicotinamide mononucleotide transporter
MLSFFLHTGNKDTIIVPKQEINYIRSMKNFSLPRLNPFNWALIAAIVLLSFIDLICLGKTDGYATIAAIAGVICVVLSAKGHILCYLFGLIEVSLYIIISWETRLYGEVMLNGLYFLPMQFIGFYNWKKNIGSESIVKVHNLNNRQKLLLLTSCITLTLAYGFLLENINGNIPYLDAGTTVLSVIAMLLMVRAFVEQWWLWIVIDLLTVSKWLIALNHNESNAAIMVAMWSIFLINSIYGYWNWRRLKENK